MKVHKTTRRLVFVCFCVECAPHRLNGTCLRAARCKKRIFIGLMTLECELEASNEGLKGRNYVDGVPAAKPLLESGREGGDGGGPNHRRAARDVGTNAFRGFTGVPRSHETAPPLGPYSRTMPKALWWY